MKHRLISLLPVTLLLGAPHAHADAYRCTQPNGSTSFQDHPCPGTSKGGSYDLPSAQGYAPPPAPVPPSQKPGAAAANAGTAQQLKALTDQLEAAAKESRCRSARRDLGVLGEQRPVFSRDDSGNRVYVDDKDRPAAAAAAQEQIDANCE